MTIAMRERLLREFGPERVQSKTEASPIGRNLSDLRDAARGCARVFGAFSDLARLTRPTNASAQH
jgi:4-hydroxy-tetrahydrodipicolinate synthase